MEHLMRLILRHVFGFLWLEEGTKNMEAGNQWPSPDHSESIAAEVMVWLPELVIVEVGLDSVLLQKLWVRVLWSCVCIMHLYNVLSLLFLLLVILMIVRGWVIHRTLEIQISPPAVYLVVSIVTIIMSFSRPFCYVIMAIISWESSCAEAFKALNRMQWSSIMITLTRTRAIIPMRFFKIWNPVPNKIKILFQETKKDNT